MKFLKFKFKKDTSVRPGQRTGQISIVEQSSQTMDASKSMLIDQLSALEESLRA